MLTERQLGLLTAIIDSYINTSEPVGSVDVVKKYNMKCSAATIRNEMAKLLSLGYLEMPHTSSGRVPTKQAYRLYLDELMQEDELPILQEVALKQRLWPNRFHFEKMLREAMIALAEITNSLAMATTSDGFMAHAGAVNVLENKEFWEIDSAKAALIILDNAEMLERVFQAAPYGGDVKTVLEDELGIHNLRKSSIVFSPYHVGNRSGHIAVLGPSRINYAKVIPAIRYTKKVVEELGEAW